jgi:hypothetical protein
MTGIVFKGSIADDSRKFRHRRIYAALRSGMTPFACWLCCACTVSASLVAAQTQNDDIVNRWALELDGDYIRSSTSHSTVEWSCISKALTNRCLQYHNDQWFTFHVQTAGKYYVNISTLACRRAYGVQAIVIAGNPCEVKTYKIIACVPKIMEEEAFITIDSVQANTPYLINIDGFLGDACDFMIQLSQRPHGVSVRATNLNALNLTHEQIDSVVHLRWQLPEDGQGLHSFRVFRKAGNSGVAKLVAHLPLNINARGVLGTAYQWMDTLNTTGTYTYEIRGMFATGEAKILDRRAVAFYLHTKSISRQILDVMLDFKDRTPVRILLIDTMRDKVLTQRSLAFNRVADAHHQIDVSRYVAAGIKTFTVRVLHGKRERAVDDFFFVGEDGSVTRR